MATINKKKNKNPTGKDSRFFTTSRKGENHELREELRSPVRDRKKDAGKKVIANMTVVLIKTEDFKRAFRSNRPVFVLINNSS